VTDPFGHWKQFEDPLDEYVFKGQMSQKVPPSVDENVPGLQEEHVADAYSEETLPNGQIVQEFVLPVLVNPGEHSLQYETWFVTKSKKVPGTQGKQVKESLLNWNPSGHISIV
jgi:hypothetical protein